MGLRAGRRLPEGPNTREDEGLLVNFPEDWHPLISERGMVSSELAPV